VSWGAEWQFENEALMAVRLANFISGFLQVVDPKEVFPGTRVVDKPLTEDQVPVLPKVTNILPKVTNILPKVANILPKARNILPKVTNILPKVTNMCNLHILLFGCFSSKCKVR
jgi:hypothetical protein